MANFDTRSADDKVTFSGTLPLAVVLGFVPLQTGVRVVVADAGRSLFDVTVPGGAYDKTLKTGWKVNNTGTQWTFSSPTAVGWVVTKVKVSQTKAAVKFKVSGKKGSFAVPPVSFPLQATLVLHPPLATGGECGESALTAPMCVQQESDHADVSVTAAATDANNLAGRRRPPTGTVAARRRRRVHAGEAAVN